MKTKAKTNTPKEYKNPKVYVNVCIPYEDYIMAKEHNLNLSEVARTGFKMVLETLV